MKFTCIDDKLWGFIQPLPPFSSEGRPRADNRRTIDAILYVLKTGIPWNDLPEEYGDDVTAWRRLKEWEGKGVWKRVTDAMVAKGYSTGAADMETLYVDSDTIPAKKGELLLALMATRGSRGRRSTRL